ncbi:MAG: NADH-quinone oxidoreductase subunit NuoE [Anaerolineae bacterium]
MMKPGQLASTDLMERVRLLTALYVAQEQYGHLTEEAIERVAERLHMAPGKVYETATFYSMYRMEPMGRYVIQVCEGLSCHLAGGAERLLEYLVERLGIEPGGTTQDGLFSLVAVQCLASCDASPAMRVNDTLYTDLTFDEVDSILDQLGGR